MGRRKFKLGRSHKNFERKRQLDGKNAIGRPSRRNKGEVIVNIIIIIHMGVMDAVLCCRGKRQHPSICLFRETLLSQLIGP